MRFSRTHGIRSPDIVLQLNHKLFSLPDLIVRFDFFVSFFFVVVVAV